MSSMPAELEATGEIEAAIFQHLAFADVGADLPRALWRRR